MSNLSHYLSTERTNIDPLTVSELNIQHCDNPVTYSNTHPLDFFFISPGPRLFLSCPLDVEGSRVWFTDLWNYSLVPYLLEAVREGLQVRPGKIN